MAIVYNIVNTLMIEIGEKSTKKHFDLSLISVVFIEIVKYLNCRDAYNLCLVSKRYKEIVMSPVVWNNLLQRDFGIVQDPQQMDMAMLYQNTLLETKQISQLRMTESADFRKERKQENNMKLLSTVLDFTQIYLFIPLCLISLFVFFLFLSFHVDQSVGSVDNRMSIWVVFSPLYVLFGYSFVSVSICIYMYKDNGAVWHRIRNPLQSVLSCLNPRISIYLLSVCILFCTFIILLNFKLSLSKEDTTEGYYNWGIIFIPMWFILLSYCVTPCLGVIDDWGSFVIGTLVIWLPITILSVCLVMKLDGMEHVLSHTTTSTEYSYANMKLALIFIPLWILEGGVMLLLLWFFVAAYLRYRMGYIDTYVSEIGGACFWCWVIFGAFMTTQIMLCLKFDRSDYHYSITTLEIVMPLLLLLSGLILLYLYMIMQNNTNPLPQIQHMEMLRSLSGTANIYTV